MMSFGGAIAQSTRTQSKPTETALMQNLHSRGGAEQEGHGAGTLQFPRAQTFGKPKTRLGSVVRDGRRKAQVFLEHGWKLSRQSLNLGTARSGNGVAGSGP